MGFETPSAFLLFIPFFFLFVVFGKGVNDYYIHPYAYPRKCCFFISSLPSVLFFLSIVFIITALSGPSLRYEKVRYLTNGENYFFILDISPSMSVIDIDGESRIIAAKKIITDFRKTRGNDYPGLILFSDEAFLSVPPTPDFKWFDKAVERADIIYPDRGTSIGDAVALAVFYLKKSASEERIGILISDGISNTGRISPEAASRIASENNVKIYTVSVGSGTDKSENEVSAVLEKIAFETGAHYFEGKGKKGLDYALSFIGRMEERKRISEKAVELINYSDIFVIIGIICALLSVYIKMFIIRAIEP